MDAENGIYVPLSEHYFLKGKLPDISKTIERNPDKSDPFPAALFTNGLIIPADYGSPSFDPERALAPKLRATNIGFIVVTHEFDCEQLEQFEEILAWTRGRDGDLSDSVIAGWDREISQYRDYRGYSVVFTGRRSLHFHFLFSTEHLEHASFEATAVERRADPIAQSALLANAYQTYWDIVHEVLHRLVKPPCPSDPRLRSLTQWRRCPWGIRVLEKDAPILKLPKGAEVSASRFT